MNEEVKVKMNIPMFQEGELETFDNNIHTIIEKYTKLQLHEKEQILTQRIIIKQEQEIERLNNIINELEKELDRSFLDLFEYELVNGRELISNIKNYIQELKGDK